MDEEESGFALSFITRRLLSEPKIVKNSRIVVIGGSDCGISFIEALLSISYLQFTNVTLVTPGGLSHHHYQDKEENLKAYSTSYTVDELKRLMLENRIRVIDGRMVDIDRGDKNVILHNNSIIPYDTLVLTMGLQDKTLTAMGYVSRGMTPIPKDKKRMEGLLSIDDPTLYQHLRPHGTLMKVLTNRKENAKVVLYGRSINTYACIQGLMQRGVNPKNISLVIPEETCHVEEFYNEEVEMMLDLPIINPDAFEDEYIEGKIQEMLVALGVEIHHNCQAMKILEDEENSLRGVLFKKLDVNEHMPEEEEEEEEGMRDGYSEGEGDMDEGEGDSLPKKRRKRNELELECKVFITAGHRDVDPDVFNSIHNNGLVYNGRLIVDKNF